MKLYKIKEVSKLTSLSIRSLQYYDDIDLLKPSQRSEADYRLYSEDDLIRLQQITTLKFLGCSLATIKSIIHDPEFNLSASLDLQAVALSKKAAQISEAAALLTYIASQAKVGQPINWFSTTQIITILEASTMKDSLKDSYQNDPNQSELGQHSNYENQYNPERLYPIPREPKRKEINLDPATVRFYGVDCWNHYEVSWLNPKGKPMVARAVITYDCHTPYIVESKSLKLYFNSFNNTIIEDIHTLTKIIIKDLSHSLQGEVAVHIIPLAKMINPTINTSFSGICLDDLDVDCSDYQLNTSYLTTVPQHVDEIVYSDLLKSNCLVTNQPDWGSVQIAYRGHQIDHEGLLKYIVSFRNHNEFHEQCIERIFIDIMNKCQPESLTVYGRYTRRGGIDINPYRSTEPLTGEFSNIQLVRQ